MEFKKAVKTRVKARMAIAGPTGSGKTYTGLTAATAFARDTRIAVIDTERGSASLYADIFDFDVLELHPPYDPLRYVEAIHTAEENGYGVLLIDSLSHAWEDEGGALDQVDKYAAKYKGNNWAAWRNVTPKHRRMVHAMLQYDGHLITTMRSKMEHVQETDVNGKTIIKKIGLQPIQRPGMEYEFTWVIDMDIDHNAVVSKSRAATLADLVVNKPDVGFFKQFYDWLMTGEEPQRSKRELVEFGRQLGLSAADVGEALAKAELEWDPSNWNILTNAVAEFAENNNDKK